MQGILTIPSDYGVAAVSGVVDEYVVAGTSLEYVVA